MVSRGAISMKIEYKRLYEQVITILKNKIEQGDFLIGEKLPSERELSKELNVSRGTLRDAFRILESQEVIETKPGGGRILLKEINPAFESENRFIDEIKQAAILELIEARQIIEIGIIDLVCQNAEDEELYDLKRILEKAHENGVITDENTDFIFHYSLAKASKNSVLINFIELNLNLINEARNINFDNKQHVTAAHQEHTLIIDALISRDANKAKQAMAHHFAKIKERMEEKQHN